MRHLGCIDAGGFHIRRSVEVYAARGRLLRCTTFTRCPIVNRVILRFADLVSILSTVSYCPLAAVFSSTLYGVR